MMLFERERRERERERERGERGARDEKEESEFLLQFMIKEGILYIHVFIT